MLISSESRRAEPPADEPHFHVWTDRGLVMICQPPRFRTSQAARKAAIRSGLEPGRFAILRCRLPCRFTLPRKRRRRKPCRHCGKRR